MKKINPINAKKLIESYTQLSIGQTIEAFLENVQRGINESVNLSTKDHLEYVDYHIQWCKEQSWEYLQDRTNVNSFVTVINGLK